MVRFQCYRSHNPLAATNPLRSMPLSRPVSAVFGPCKRVRVEAELRNAAEALAAEFRVFAEERAALGVANRRPMTTRRYWQAQALRRLNGRRVLIRAARRRLQVAQAAVEALTPVDDFLWPWQAVEAGVIPADHPLAQPLHAGG